MKVHRRCTFEPWCRRRSWQPECIGQTCTCLGCKLGWWMRNPYHLRRARSHRICRWSPGCRCTWVGSAYRIARRSRRAWGRLCRALGRLRLAWGHLRRGASRWPRIGRSSSSLPCTCCRSSSYHRGHRSGSKRRCCPKKCRPTRPCRDPSCRDSRIHRSSRKKHSCRSCRSGHRSRHSSSSLVQRNRNPSIGQRCKCRYSSRTSPCRPRSYCCNSSRGLRIGCPNSTAAQAPRS